MHVYINNLIYHFKYFTIYFILHRWRVFLTNMMISPERAEHVVLAACALHNFLRTRLPSYTNSLLDKEDDLSHEVTPGDWRKDGGMASVGPLRGNTALAVAKHQRDHLCHYVNGIGAVPWQDRLAGI
jgi:hypothetical protein